MDTAEPERQEELLVFLKRTREGKYAKVNLEADAYLRWENQRTDIPVEEVYLYRVL